MAREKRRFLVDENGHRESIVLPVKEYEELLGDSQDLAVIAERREEPVEPLEAVAKKL